MTGDVAGEVRRRRGRPPAQSGEETKARLLSAARTCFCRAGYARTSMADIAREAGVTSRAIYHYVDSKSALFALAVEAAYARFVEEVVTWVFARPHDSTRSRLQGYAHVFRVLYQEDPSLVGFLSLAVLEATRNPELVAALPGDLHRVPNFNELIVTDAVKKGELTPEVQASGAVALLDVFGAGLTLVATKERSDDYLAMLDVIEHLLAGTLFTR